MSVISWRAGNLIGPAEQVCEKVASYVEAGVAGVVGWCSDYPDIETLERLARDVVPNFR
jgi:hypothetical protein